MKRGKTKPLFKPFIKNKTPKWSRQQLMIKLSNQKQAFSDPIYLYGKERTLFGIAKYN